MDSRDNFENLPEKIREHLKVITESSGLPDSEESLQIITANWLEKRRLFEGQISNLGMKEVESFNKGDTRGVLMLTYSGSLISLGTLSGSDGIRSLEYASIKLRSDVPDIIKENDVCMAGDARIDHPAEFTGSVIKKTSALYTIALCDESVNKEEQEKRIKEATIFLTNGFMKINRTLAINKDQKLEHFSNRTMAGYIAKINGTTVRQTKQIIDDFLYLVETGALLGEKVPLGRLGRLFLKKRPAQKARVVKNPATGEEMTIPAKPEMAVPKMRFSKQFKDKAEITEI